MRKYLTIFDLVSDVFNKANAPSVLIGGFAINYYKVTRQTMDVDFMIAEEDYENILKLLEKTGYKEDYKQKAFAHLKGNDYYLMDIDLMFVDKDTLLKIMKEVKNVKIAGQTFKIPSIKHLIMLKVYALKNNYKIRELKDLPDIVNLIRKNKLDIKSTEYKNIFVKYGNIDIYNKILNLV